MNTSDLILILLQNKNLSNRNKFLSIVEIISSWLIDKYFFVFPEKAKQQISSEILYLFEKYEKSKRATRAWITTRLNLLKKTLLEQGLIRLRTAFEVGIDFMENLSPSERENLSLSEVENFSSSEQPEQPEEENTNFLLLEEAKPKYKRTGWQDKTYRRFEKFVLRRSPPPKKKRKIEVVPLTGLK